MSKKFLPLVFLCTALALSGCRGNDRPVKDEDEKIITDGDCDDATWDDVCLAKDNLSEIYQYMLEKKDSGELPEINDGSMDIEALLSESADLINEFASAHKYNYNALDARAKADRMTELEELLNKAAGY